MDKGHGRLEKRTITTTTARNHHVDGPGVKPVCRVVRKRTPHGQCETATADAVSSVSHARAHADPLRALIRDHGILEHGGALEHGGPHVRDTTFDEDRCTIFRGHAAQNLAACRNTARNWPRLIGTVHLAATPRSFTPQSQRLFTKLGLVN